MTSNNGYHLKCRCDGGSSHCGSSHDCRHDLLHELSRRLDTIRRCHQYIMNTNGNLAIIDFWRSIYQQELDNIQQLHVLLSAMEGDHLDEDDSHVLCDFVKSLSDTALGFHKLAPPQRPVVT